MWNHELLSKEDEILQINLFYSKEYYIKKTVPQPLFFFLVTFSMAAVDSSLLCRTKNVWFWHFLLQCTKFRFLPVFWHK